jgi:hypothetical protein
LQGRFTKEIRTRILKSARNARNDENKDHIRVRGEI